MIQVVPKNYTYGTFDEGENLSTIYHNIFDYPLTFAELIKWKAGKLAVSYQPLAISQKKNLVYQRLMRKKISEKKMIIAKKASKIISLLPSVKLVAVTGSLAMENSTEESDIDLMIVTKSGTLWFTRLLVHLILFILAIPVRRAGRRDEKDKLCLNIWLDETDLVFRNRNIYTAHEIAQIVPLVNKDKTYEKFLYKNKWILNYWPNSVKIRNPKSEIQNNFENSKFKYLNIISSFVLRASNFIAFRVQYHYMKKKITRETVAPTRALFHPQDWSKIILSRLTS